MRVREGLIMKGQESLEELFGGLLGVEAGRIEGTLTVEDAAGGGEIALGLKESATSMADPIHHKGLSLLEGRW